MIVSHNSLKVHEEALRGFKSRCKASLREYAADAAAGEIAEAKPRLIYAIGSDALKAALQIRGIPIVFALVLLQDSMDLSGRQVTGVRMTISPPEQLSVLKSVLPRVRRIGVVYNPKETGATFRDSKIAAELAGLSLVGRTASTPAEAIRAMESLRGKIDLFLMLPDTSLMDYETVKYMLLFSFETNTPIFAVSDRFVKNGALLGLNIDPFDIGRQAGEMAGKILSGRNARDIPVSYARTGALSINMTTARKLGISISPSMLKTARVYGGLQ